MAPGEKPLPGNKDTKATFSVVTVSVQFMIKQMSNEQISKMSSKAMGISKYYDFWTLMRTFFTCFELCSLYADA